MKPFFLVLALLALASPASAQCGCYGYGGVNSTWGGESALAVTPDYYLYGVYRPGIDALGYRNGYIFSDDEVYGYRPPLIPRRYRVGWGWRWR